LGGGRRGWLRHLARRTRAWSALWSIVSHQELPDEMPEDLLEEWEEESPVGLLRFTRDDPEDYPAVERAPAIKEENRRTVEKLLEKVRA
jgi:acetoin utilization protein AcuC